MVTDYTAESHSDQHPPQSRRSVAIWPGSKAVENEFVRSFSSNLRRCGWDVIEVNDPREITSPVDILHIHWPEQLFWHRARPLSLFIRALRVDLCIGRLKREGTKVVWMVHNLNPHELTFFNALIWRYFRWRILKMCDGFLTLSPSTIDVVRRQIPRLSRLPAAASLHPSYALIEGLPTALECRENLSIGPNDTVFALLGLLRPYKSIERLIEAFSQATQPHYRLIIAGRADSDEYARHLQQLSSLDHRITLRTGRLDDREFAMYLLASDKIVLPYADYLHSGAMVHAISYSRQVITPATPFSDDLAAAVGEEWVVRYKGTIDVDILENCPKPATPPSLDVLRPAVLAEVASNLYSRLGR